MGLLGLLSGNMAAIVSHFAFIWLRSSLSARYCTTVQYPVCQKVAQKLGRVAHICSLLKNSLSSRDRLKSSIVAACRITNSMLSRCRLNLTHSWITLSSALNLRGSLPLDWQRSRGLLFLTIPARKRRLELSPFPDQVS